MTCDRHCSTATADVHRTRHRFFTVHADVTPTRVLPAPTSHRRHTTTVLRPLYRSTTTTASRSCSEYRTTQLGSFSKHQDDPTVAGCRGLITNCYITGNQRPHHCCHLQNYVDNTDHTPDIPYT